MHFNLSHMDFLGGPVAFYGSRLIIPKTRKDESPNEHKDPEIFANNHLKTILEARGKPSTFVSAGRARRTS